MLHSPREEDSEMFGQELTLNLYNCNLATISSRTKIRKFVIELCDEIIHMKRYGKAFIPHFGHENPITSGYSLVQLIETSAVTAHFSEYKKAVYLNIFSCAWFDAKITTRYCKKYFSAKTVKAKLTKRP
jgi:S-adenosylmethionine decarboxylase